MPTSPPDLFEDIAKRIAAFSHRAENETLVELTGSWSALPRGPLFGSDRATDVAKKLRERRVKVLFVGANPGNGLPSSGRHLGSLSDYIKSGSYGEAYWNAHGDAVAGWNPFSDPGNWKWSYGRLLKQIEAIDDSTMINFIPWRSGKLPEFVGRLTTGGHRMLDLVFSFCDGIHRQVVEAMNPELIVVTHSIAKDFGLSEPPVFAESRARNIQRWRVKVGSENAINYRMGELLYGDRTHKVLYVPHPSSLRQNQTLEVFLSEATPKLKSAIC